MSFWVGLACLKSTKATRSYPLSQALPSVTAQDLARSEELVLGPASRGHPKRSGHAHQRSQLRRARRWSKYPDRHLLRERQEKKPSAGQHAALALSREPRAHGPAAGRHRRRDVHASALRSRRLEHAPEGWQLGPHVPQRALPVRESATSSSSASSATRPCIAKRSTTAWRRSSMRGWRISSIPIHEFIARSATASGCRMSAGTRPAISASSRSAAAVARSSQATASTIRSRSFARMRRSSRTRIPAQASATRQRLLEQYANTDAIFFPAHFTGATAGRVEARRRQAS